jgi:hypothetical protein
MAGANYNNVVSLLHEKGPAKIGNYSAVASLRGDYQAL